MKEVMGYVGPNYRGIDPPMEECPECNGKGKVHQEQADRFNPYFDYTEAEAENYAEHRREWEEER
jgi:hypothetical protein